VSAAAPIVVGAMAALIAAPMAWHFAIAPQAPGPGNASPLPCAGRLGLLQHLAETYGERPIGRGAAPDAVVELTLGPDADWTLLATLPTGETCVIATGTGWEWIRREEIRS
jgi:hypothetical protein